MALSISSLQKLSNYMLVKELQQTHRGLKANVVKIFSRYLGPFGMSLSAGVLTQASFSQEQTVAVLAFVAAGSESPAQPRDHLWTGGNPHRG